MDDYLKTCPACNSEFVTSDSRRRGCSPGCNRVLRQASWWFYDDDYEKGRISLAQSIVARPDLHSPSQVRWAQGFLIRLSQTGRPPAPTTRYLLKNSRARQVMEEVLGEERTQEVVREARQKTVRNT